MLWFVLVVVALIIAAIAMFSRKYSKLFDETTFEEFYECMIEAIRAAVQAQGELSTESMIDNGMGFRLSADIAASVTFAQQEDGFLLHIALSQPDGVTTHAASSRFRFFLLAMLNKNQVQIMPFSTPSHLHHILLKLESADIVFNSFEESYREYQQNYQLFPVKATDEPQSTGE